ncbi:MAG: YlbF family regulator [Bacillaceae bacterium]|nr:YlbF family regulator [Bacillaceae bacterium]
MSVTLTEILSEAYDLSDMIISSEIFNEYVSNKRCVQQDTHAQQLISTFNKKKEEYEEAARFGRFHPDFDRVAKEVRVVKREMDLYEPIASFKKAEKKLEELLNEISVLVARSVSDKIKVPTGNPFFDSKSCGTGCGTGGKCGCK